MKFANWKAVLALTLMGSSVLIYLTNYFIFKDINYMLRLFLAQLGFLPVSVLLVTIIINQLLSQHARRAKLAKLNMVIGAFFSDVGAELMKILAGWDLNREALRRQVSSLNRWSDQDFAQQAGIVTGYEADVEMAPQDLAALKDFLLQKRDFLLRLLENPNLLEHDSFSNLLLAVFHLTEELAHRPHLPGLSAADQEHLTADVRRTYILLLGEWLAYMQHLKKNYPYLLSLALRTNPFEPEASVEIK
ncbi:MAG: hypothetical protein FJ126_12710 [Deltaproteobacteria bacterium]|nr:hypothetical protein [Deltaproteobacteria bacterium]